MEKYVQEMSSTQDAKGLVVANFCNFMDAWLWYKIRYCQELLYKYITIGSFVLSGSKHEDNETGNRQGREVVSGRRLGEDKDINMMFYLASDTLQTNSEETLDFIYLQE